MRKVASVLIRVSISAGILFFLLKLVEVGKVIQTVSHANKPILILAFLMILCIYFLGFLRWRILLFGLGLDVSNFLIFRSYCIGYFFNLFFPSTIGGDLMRGTDLGLRIHKSRRIVASIILDRISGYSALATICLLALFVGRRLVLDRAVFFLILVDKNIH